MKSRPTATGVLGAILQFNKDRKPGLLRLKLRKMRADPFTFFRGADHLPYGQDMPPQPPRLPLPPMDTSEPMASMSLKATASARAVGVKLIFIDLLLGPKGPNRSNKPF